MNKCRLWAVGAALGLLVLLSGCASAPPGRGGGEAALLERATAFWAARVAGDHVTAYEYAIASTQPDVTLQRYLGGQGGMKFERAEVKGVERIEGDEAVVRVSMAYRIPMPGLRKPIEADLQDSWRLVDGQWYHAPRPSVMWQ